MYQSPLIGVGIGTYKSGSIEGLCLGCLAGLVVGVTWPAIVPMTTVGYISYILSPNKRRY